MKIHNKILKGDTVNLFHFNPKTGIVGRCRAEYKCPFNFTREQHFSTFFEAQQAYEHTMTDKIFKTIQNSKNSLDLNNYMDIEFLNKMFKERYVDQRRHPDDDTLSVLCYSRSVQYEGKWNDVTKKTRGLIVQSSKSDFSDAVIVQRPWEKFFTLSQIENGWALGDEENTTSAGNAMSLIDFDASVETTDKLDGSMGILYRAPNGEPALSTKGSFVSDQALYYTKFLKNSEKFYEAADNLLKKHGDTTFIFELLSDGKHQIVLNYEEDDVVFIGAVDKSSGLYRSTDDYITDWSDHGLKSAEKLPAKTVREALSLPDRENREGVVLRIMSEDPDKQMQLKVKQEDYLRLHKLIHSFSKDDGKKVLRKTQATIGDLIKASETRSVTHFSEVSAIINEVSSLGKQAEKVHQQRKEFFEKAILERADKVTEAKTFVDELPDTIFVGSEREVKKRFAMMVKKSEIDKAAAFALFNARLNGMDIKDLDASKEMDRAAQNV